jgi:hypothetical protein
MTPRLDPYTFAKHSALNWKGNWNWKGKGKGKFNFHRFRLLTNCVKKPRSAL